MVVNKILFSKLFIVAGFCFIFPIHVSADLYGEGAYGSERYSGNNSTTTAPNAPTSINAVAGNSQASISFTPPINNGGSPITSYIAISSPGDITASGLTSPIIVTGLTNGISYNFTMIAINSVGTSSTSTVSNTITPLQTPSPSVNNWSPGSTSGASSIPTSLINPIVNNKTSEIPKEESTNTTQNVQAVVFTFNKDIATGGVDSEVKSLQKFLNKNGFIVSQTGPGSLGNETTLFGPATRAALIKFQKANNISPAIGYFGPTTRTLINSLLTKEPGNTSAVETTTYTRNLELNMTGDDVKSLQKFLNKNGFIVSQTGPGSLGNETTLFGPATRSALIRFQKDKNISPAIGYFGPVTRAAIEKYITN